MITQKKLKSVLKYYPLIGDFIWIKKTSNYSRIKIGSKAGYVKNDGYRVIEIYGKSYAASRLAFLYMLGYFPEHEAEHKDRIRDNNKWSNLREATRSCNMKNIGIQDCNKTGVVGVIWKWQNKKWVAQIGINKTSIYLGSFIKFYDAVKARWDAEVKYDFPTCNTTSTAYKYLNMKRIKA